MLYTDAVFSLAAASLQALVYQIEGTLLGLRSSLPELSSVTPPSNSKPLHVVGACGPPIGNAAVREEVGRAMLAALRAVGSNDFESLSLMLRVSGSNCLVRECSLQHQTSEMVQCWLRCGVRTAVTLNR